MFACEVFSRESALDQAETTARILLRGAANLGRTKLRDVPLMAWLPFLAAGRDVKEHREPNIDACDPRIREVLLFGSLALGEGDVGDVDLMVLDSGFYSLPLQVSSRNSPGKRRDSKDFLLQDNLWQVLGGYMGYGQDVIDRCRDIPTDLHVLPYSVVTDEAFRVNVAHDHHDQHFFDHVFECMMRFDKVSDEFVPVTLEELQARLRFVLPQ
jgi:hypothetical protein